LQRDPIDAASGDPNLYRYAGNDPLNFTDVDGAKGEAKQPNQSAGKKAKEKAQEKIAFICVGDIEVETGIPIVGGIVDWLGQQATNMGVARDIRRLRREFEQAGYKVIVDEECTEEDIEKALRNPNVKAFAFIGHSAATNDLVVPAGGGSFSAADAERFLGGRKLERVVMHTCFSSQPNPDGTIPFREAMTGSEGQYEGSVGTWNPALGMDMGTPKPRKGKWTRKHQQRERR
jgi:hypothetical protein